MSENKTMCYCQDCRWTGVESEVKADIPDILERVAPGETMPVGECPKCGALCQYEKEDE